MKIIKEIFRYLFAPALSVLIFFFIFQLWKVDFSMPFFSYDGDVFLSAFSTKTIIDSGWYFSNDFIGWPHFRETFFSHDFPSHADFSNFLIIKIFSYFSSNPFLIINCFFIFTLALVALSSFVVLKSFKISDITAVMISVLYSLTHYHFARGVYHLFLSNYAAVPLIIMVCLWIMSDKIQLLFFVNKQKLHLEVNRFFIIALLVSIYAATSGIYYALYGCIIFVFAYFLRSIELGSFWRRDLLPLTILCCTIFLILFFLHLPTIIYWAHNGFNEEAFARNQFQSEFFGLKIINLLIPVENHYLQYFASIGKSFYYMALEHESAAENLGIIGAIGFLFLMLWPMVKSFSTQENSFLSRFIKNFSITQSDQNLITNLAGLNFLIVIFATVGGLVMMLSFYFPLLRSHARFSIFIDFLALFFVAIIIDKVLARNSSANRNFAEICLVIFMIAAVYDQIGKVSANNVQNGFIIKDFNSDKNFVAEIEKNMPQGAKIFMMPVVNFPEGGGHSYNLIKGYLHSKKLNWSHPSMKNRYTALWQKEVSKLNFENLVFELQNVGFSGIYIDRTVTADNFDAKKLETYLSSVTKSPPIISNDSKLIFFKI